jgi:chromosome segregation ATPase
MSENEKNSTQTEEITQQEEGKEVVYFGTRVKEEDKKTFVDLGKQLNLTQHELFNKVLDTFLKMESIEGVTESNKGHAEELRGHLDRILAIFLELVTSSENIRENIKKSYKEELSQKQGKIKDLESRIENMKLEKKAIEEKLDKAYDKEMSYYKEIDGLRKSIELDKKTIEDKNTIIKEKDNTIKSLSVEVEGYKELKEKYEKQSERVQELSGTISNLEAKLAEADRTINNKTMEISNLLEKEKMLNERIKELVNENKDRTKENTKLKEESQQEISSLRQEVKELNNKLIEKMEKSQITEKKYMGEIALLKEREKSIEDGIKRMARDKNKLLKALEEVTTVLEKNKWAWVYELLADMNYEKI